LLRPRPLPGGDLSSLRPWHGVSGAGAQPAGWAGDLSHAAVQAFRSLSARAHASSQRQAAADAGGRVRAVHLRPVRPRAGPEQGRAVAAGGRQYRIAAVSLPVLVATPEGEPRIPRP